MTGDEETPKELRFQRYVNDWSLHGRPAEGIKRGADSSRILAAETFHALTTDKTLAYWLYQRISKAKELLKRD